MASDAAQPARRAGASCGPGRFYDWGNSAFATTVMAGLLPALLQAVLERGQRTSAREHVAPGRGELDREPARRADARRCSARSRTAAAARSASCSRSPLLGVVTTAALYFVGKGEWLTAAPALRARDRRLRGQHRLLRQL